MDSSEMKIENFAYAADVTLPAAREFTRLLEEGVELFGDERRCKDYVAQKLSEACGNGEPWATDFATAQVHHMIARCVEREAEPVAAVARVLRVDRSTAERWVREATGR